MSYDYNYSFIIPHKNIPDLLKRCVDSIPRRKDVQIIVVDDNSDPNKVDFDNFPYKDDQSVELILDTTGLGAGHARNIGFEHAKGKWVIFADADDFFMYCLSDLLDDYVDSDADLIFFQSISLDSNTYHLAHEQRSGGNKYVTEFINGVDGSEDKLRFCHHVPWCKIVRHKMMEDNHIKFDEIKRCNDTHFSYLVGYYAKIIKGDLRAVYCVTDRENSTVKNPTAEKEALVNRVFTDELAFMQSHGYADKPVYALHYRAVIDSILKIKQKNSSLYEDAVNRLAALNIPRRKIIYDVSILSLRRKVGRMLSLLTL